MKKIIALFLIAVMALGVCSFVQAEETVPFLVVTGAMGSRPSMETKATRDNSVVPFAVVSWGDTVETVAEATGGEIGEQNGNSVITSYVQIEGLSSEIPVIYSFGENGLKQVEAIAADHLAEKICDLSASASGQAIIKQTDSFFSGDDQYIRSGDGVKVYMSSTTTAGLRCRGEEKNYRLSVVYYPPDPFDIGTIEAAEGVSRREIGHDMQYYPSSLDYFADPNLIDLKFTLYYLITVYEYQQKEYRIPCFDLIFYAKGSVDLGEVKSMSFLIDNQQYTFTNIIKSNTNASSSEWNAAYVVRIGESSADFWRAILDNNKPVDCTFTFVREGEEVSYITFDSLDNWFIEPLAQGYHLYRDAHGLSPLALDYASANESSMSVQKQDDIPGLIPTYTLDASVIPFVELSWNAKINALSKDLDVKAEKEGDTNIIRSTVSIDGLGNDLPVTYTFRNNRLVSVKLLITHDYEMVEGFDQSVKGRQLKNYIDSFVGNHPKYTYHSFGSPSTYILSDVTEIAYGVLKNGTSYDLSMEFFPAQKYDVSILKKNKKITSSPSENNVIYYDLDPAFFEHPYTYDGNRFTYSYFQWVIMIRDVSHTPGKIPILYYCFTYNGVKDPSSAQWLSFAIDNENYRFELKSQLKEKLSKTQYGELSQTYEIMIDCNNYVFLEKLAKGKKVEVTLQGGNFMMSFQLPPKAKQKMVEGMRYFEKVCGIVDGPLASNRFQGSPMTIY